MTTGDKVMGATILGSVLFLGAIAVPNIHTALQRARQKRTMASIRDAAQRHEAGKPLGNLIDAWGIPMQIRTRGRHYSIRAAMSDRRFESGIPRGVTHAMTEDVVFIDGNFRQYPGGL